MTPAARLSAAIDVLQPILSLRRPAADALKDWGLSSRFAGSKDRASVATLVYDALRVRSSAAWLMGEDSARAAVLGSLRLTGGMDEQAIASLCVGESHAPSPLSEEERARLRRSDALQDAPAWVRGDYPEWLAAAFERAFEGRSAEAGQALARRAPVDLRVNTLKATRQKALDSLVHLGAAPTAFSPWGLRVPLGPDGRNPAVVAEPAYVKGRVEIQDEGSQLAALLTGARPGWQALDLCAGGGGKTLALAAMMENRGQIYATDSDARRLSASFSRLERGGVRNVQVRPPRGGAEIADLEERCDVVLVDAPCTGSGAWRRNPDAKWRIRPSALEQRIAQQDAALARAAQFVKRGGAIIYATCSVFREENEERVDAFLRRRSDFLPIEAAHLARRAGASALAEFSSQFGAGLRLSPLTTGTDGFYVAGLLRG